MFTKFKYVKNAWVGLGKTAKMVYGCFFFNIILLMGISTKRYLANKKAIDFYSNKIILSNNENDDWSCYNSAKQYRYECAYLNEEQINDFEICEKLHIQLENCRNKLYEYIKEDTPAMKNIPYIINKPTWMKEPLWFENIKKLKSNK
ncbi:conserved Plasmodium protein, unknown function [Plasmodium gaboni]|uniref:Uncharacterized protein n=1 Tax=Plasmodium gaboni TaxID=647221 RepID=A0ABY1UQG8_9APIC|nr:conserved Plasmodium protein, unknown function [Plasmodium gaboni]